LRGSPSTTESRYLLVLVATVVIFLSPALMTSRILWPGGLLASFSPWSEEQPTSEASNILLMDSVEQLYPYYHFHRSEVFEGRIPLWNPYVLNGTPFSANSVSALFSPLRWLLLGLPIYLYFEYAALLKLLLAGGGVFFFCRRIGLPSDCSLLAGLCFLFAGYNIFFLTFPNAFISALLGWGLLQIESYAQTRRRIHLAWLAAILAAAYLSGNMQCAFLQQLAYLLYAFARCWDLSQLRQTIRSWNAIALATVLGLALAGVATLPFVDLMLGSYTLTERGSFVSNPYHLMPEEWPALLQPHYREGPEERIVPKWSYVSFAYVGILSCFLAGLASRGQRVARATWALGILTLWSLILVLGVPILFEVLTGLPLLRQTNYFHAGQVLQISFAVLAGVGASVWRSGHLSARAFGWLFGGALALALWSSWRPVRRWLDSEVEKPFYFMGEVFEYPLGAVWTLLTLLILPLLYRYYRQRNPVPALLLLVLINGFVFGFFFNTASPKQLLQHRPAVVDELARAPHARLVGIGMGTLLPNFGMSWRLRDLRGYEPILSDRWVRFYSELQPGARDPHHPIRDLDRARLDLLRRAGCALVVAPRRLELEGLTLLRDQAPYIYGVDGAARASIAESVLPARDGEEALRLLMNRESDALILELVGDQPLSAGAGTASWLSDLPTEIEIEVEMEQEGWLVLRDTFDPGWEAQIDQSEAKIFRADYLFRAVRVPEGKHVVRFRYRPDSFYWGTVSSLLSLAVLGGLVFSSRRSSS